MNIRKTNPINIFILLSLAAHALIFFLLDCLRPFEFTRPVVAVPVELVEMVRRNDKAGAVGTFVKKTDFAGDMRKKVEVSKSKAGPGMKVRKNSQYRTTARHLEQSMGEPGEIVDPDGNKNVREAASSNETKSEMTEKSGQSLQTRVEDLQLKVKRDASEFISVKREKLTYRIIMYGIPVGSAVLEAVNDGNEVRVSSMVSSNAVISSIYPVSDFAETRLIGGRYIISRIRQHEGNFTSDTGFTISLPEKNIFWFDRIHNRFSNNALPREDVLDVLSGLYYLRNQLMEVGKPVVLHLFDSNSYAPTTVEVLRKEHVSLPGFREADSIVVHPLIETDCIFRRAGDILVWLSDDGNRVPLRLETAVPLGRVRADLVSAEVERN